MRDVSHIDDCSAEEIARARCNANELEMMKKTDVIKALSMMNKGGLQTPQDDPWHCSRGLEARAREGAARKGQTGQVRGMLFSMNKTCSGMRRLQPRGNRARLL